MFPIMYIVNANENDNEIVQFVLDHQWSSVAMIRS